MKEVEGKDILKQGFPNLPVSDILKLEGIANRDSLPYAETYALGKLEDLRTLVRGTIRQVPRGSGIRFRSSPAADTRASPP